MSLLHLVHPDVRTLDSYSAPHGHPPIKLDANESPWPLPEPARRALEARLGAIDLHRYPDPSLTDLRGALALRLGGDPEQYVVGSGSDEIIALLATALRAPRNQRLKPVVSFPSPTFVMFGITSRVHGWDVCEVALDNDWHIPLDEWRRQVKAQPPNVVYLASPNNPTGNAFSEATVRAIIETSSDALVVLDGAYGAFTGSGLDHLFDS
ncbi:MAG: aminotransferase class I/II-fold pyridoxal phosphate-dependent enzyme, partial [Myxococcales bacterium]|nr:aminotransferase class I/II-fold pyridoxal phosphate-dependent enzyme [Myxococcales bacterium]